MNTAHPATETRIVALKYLTIGLLLGLFLAPRAGAETWERALSALQDLIAPLGGNEFTEPL